MLENSLIRVVIADSNAILREGVRAILEKEPALHIVAEAATARDAITAYQAHRPDVTILDLRMPEMECLNAIKAIRTDNPQAHILILTAYDGEEDIYRALRAGASGYILKDASPQELIEAIHAVYAGRKHIGPQVAAKLAERAANDDLSESERNILRELAQGKSNQQIAETLMVSEGTVKFHLNNILLKLDASNRTEAVVIALKRGLVRLA